MAEKVVANIVVMVGGEVVVISRRVYPMSGLEDVLRKVLRDDAEVFVESSFSAMPVYDTVQTI